MRTQGVLKYHGPCQACGSKDNKAVYEHDDGELSAYCFGCGDYAVEGSLPIINNKEYDMSLETVQDVMNSLQEDSERDVLLKTLLISTVLK